MSSDEFPRMAQNVRPIPMTVRAWCCNTPINGPHEEGCAFDPKSDNGPDYGAALPKPPSERGWKEMLGEVPPLEGWVLEFVPQHGQFPGKPITRTFVGQREKEWAIRVMLDRYGPKSILIWATALHGKDAIDG